MKKILAPTDLSELSCAGVRYALEMASVTGSEVIVYNVVGYTEASPYYGFEYGYVNDYIPIEAGIVEEHRRRLASFVRNNFADLIPSVRIKPDVEVGTPYQKIIDKAMSEKVDLIILSTHGRTGLLHACLGSVAEKVVRRAKCPVLTVRPSTKHAQAKAA